MFKLKDFKNQTRLSPPPNQGLIGHRGAPLLTPENTLVSFRQAKKLGLNWVEFDTQPCASGEWLVIHDETIDRTTNGHGNIRDLNFTALRNLDAGSWFDPKFKSERIPLLSEVLILLRELDIQPNIEIKMDQNSQADPEALKKSLLKFWSILKKYWPATRPWPLISSFDVTLLATLKSLTNDFAPDLKFGWNRENFEPQDLAVFQENQFFSLHYDYEKITLEQLENLIHQQIPILLYTVNDKFLIEQYLSMGVAALFTDNPLVLS